MMVKIPVSKRDAFFARLAKNAALYLPVDNESGQAEFRQWKDGVALSGACNTARSAKDFFFPQTENIADFKMEGKKIDVTEARPATEAFVLFGVRACDIASFDILDRVFLAEPEDSFYRARRERAVIISMACTKPEATCFCPLFAIDATKPEGDVTCWAADGDLFLEANTGKGKALLESVSDLLSSADTDGDREAVEGQKKETAKVLAALPFAKTSHEKFKGENLLSLFGSPAWAKLSEACLGCGACTFVCPTCQCYDVRDFDTGHGIKRFRCWDSCMYSDFTKMAAANPRLTQIERFRQRFMHKLVYFPSNNQGAYGCVGCGRCVAKCPVSMNIVKVMKALGEEK